MQKLTTNQKAGGSSPFRRTKNALQRCRAFFFVTKGAGGPFLVPEWDGIFRWDKPSRPGGFYAPGSQQFAPPPLTIPPRMRYTKLYKMQCGGVPRAGAFCREPGQVKAGRGAPGVVAPAGIPVPLRVRRRSRACRAGSVSGQAVSRFRFAPVTGRSSGFCAQNQFGWYRDL